MKRPKCLPRPILLLPVLLGLAAPPSSEELFEAVRRGDRAAVQELLQRDPGLANAKEELERGGETALHAAASSGHASIAEMLLEHGAVVDAGDRENTASLAVACLRNKLDVACLLLEHGADPNHADVNGMTALHFSAPRFRKDIVEVLLAEGADPNPKTVEAQDTPLHMAAWSGQLEIVQALIEAEAELEATNVHGFTPLMSALWNSQVEAAEVLLDAGASLDVVSVHGQTVLGVATSREPRKREMVELLLTKGLDVNHAPEQGWPVLFEAIWGHDRALFEVLLAAGADPNVTAHGMTPLLAAVRTDQPGIAELLLAEDPDVNTRNEQGETPLLLAVVNGSEEVAGLLLEAGAATSLTDNHWGRTPLHWAALEGHAGITGRLLAKGAEVDAKDRSGRSAADLAARYGHRDVVDLLAAKGAKVAEEAYPDPRALLEEKLAPGEAVLWYLGHCGWAVRTSEHLLVFDYWNTGADPAAPSLANGHIAPAELAGQELEVFVTHEHADHFDPVILDWADAHEDLTYVFGFRPEEQPQYAQGGYRGPDYVHLPARSERELHGMQVATIRANDAGVGFLVEVDGLTLYHAGDHAGWADGARDGFFAEVDYLAERTEQLDFVFVNVTGCHANDPERLREGTLYTVEKLHPLVTVPTHAVNREYIYTECVEGARESQLDTKVIAPQHRGDCFLFRGGEIEMIDGAWKAGS